MFTAGGSPGPPAFETKHGPEKSVGFSEKIMLNQDLKRDDDST